MQTLVLPYIAIIEDIKLYRSWLCMAIDCLKYKKKIGIKDTTVLVKSKNLIYIVKKIAM